MLHFFMINFLKRNWAVIVLLIIGILYLRNNYSGSRYSMTSKNSGYLPMADVGIDMMSSTPFVRPVFLRGLAFGDIVV